jgi:hypothetical protein
MKNLNTYSLLKILLQSLSQRDGWAWYLEFVGGTKVCNFVQKIRKKEISQRIFLWNKWEGHIYFCLFKQIGLLDVSDVCLISVPLVSDSGSKSAEAL